MIGIILAAGRGSRMGNYTLNKPKSFIVYKKKKLIDHILQNFKKNGINKIYIITGYKKNYLKILKLKKFITINGSQQIFFIHFIKLEN